MKLCKAFWRVPLAIAAVTSLLACSGGKGFDWTSLPKASPATYTPGTPVVVAQATIDEGGGTLAGPAGTPVEGVVVTFPAGAISAPTTFTLGYDEGGTFTNVPAEELSGLVIALESDGQRQFAKPLTIEFPFTDPTTVPVPYYLREDGAFRLMRPLPVDRQAGRGAFISWHASNFTWCNKNPASGNKIFFNGFAPGKNGFAFSNTISDEYAPNGRCVGISAFTKWYKETQGDGLYDRFAAPIPSKAEDKSITGEEVAATRAHISATLSGMEFEDPPLEQAILSILDAITKGDVATMIGVSSPEGFHALLAIGFSDNQIAVYDSNHPNEWKAIDYTLAPDGSKATMGYGDYNELSVLGDPPLAEDLSYILRDAQAGFNGENQTKIEITSHQSGDNVQTADITLEGKVHSGEVSIAELEVRVLYLDLTESKQIVSLTPGQEDFSVPLSLKPGENSILFTTRGYVVSGEGLRDIPYSIDPTPFLLNYEQTTKGSITANVTQVSVFGNSSDPDLRDEVTVSFSTNIVARFMRYSISRIIADTFPIDSCQETTNCVIVDAFSTTSLPDIVTNPDPPRQAVVATYSLRHYSRTDHGFELTKTADADGSSTEQLLLLKISVEPQCTEDNRQYRVTLNGGYPSFNPVSPLLVANRHLDTTTRQWVDDAPTPLPDLEFSVLDARDNTSLDTITPPRIAPAGFEDFIVNGTQPQTFSVAGTVRSSDASSSETDDATLSITLVP